MPDIEQVIVICHCTRMYANLCPRYAACAAKKRAECSRESRRWGRTWTGKSRAVPLLLHIHIHNLHATVGKPLHRDKTKWNVNNFCSCSVSSQIDELPSCASSWPRKRECKRGGNKVRAQALRQLSRTCSLTPPSNRLSFMTRGSRRKSRLWRLWFHLLFCWGSLPVVPPLPRRLQRLAATNCLKFLTA